VNLGWRDRLGADPTSPARCGVLGATSCWPSSSSPSSCDRSPSGSASPRRP
jgi:hypothetical protein